MITFSNATTGASGIGTTYNGLSKAQTQLHISILTLLISIQIIVILGSVIGQISMRMQLKLSHPMHHCQEGKRWINVYL